MGGARGGREAEGTREGVEIEVGGIRGGVEVVEV
jgi:hypothetical protein